MGFVENSLFLKKPLLTSFSHNYSHPSTPPQLSSDKSSDLRSLLLRANQLSPLSSIQAVRISELPM